MDRGIVEREDLLRRVNEVLNRIEHATVATVSVDGRPWNTPVYFARQRGSFYWISRRDAQHSMNIENNGRAFLVVFDSSRNDSSGAGVYVEAGAAALVNDGDIQDALEVIYRRRGKPVPSATEYSAKSPHAVYQAQAVRVWSNVLHASGEVPWDERVEITL
jgi:nitroimidazol reductase NimA-like FMN-containing flavoprotein (pyridoxamine 5'-phosphate oxidase superfamily)